MNEPRRLTEVEFLRLRLARAHAEMSALRLHLAERELRETTSALGLSDGDVVSEDGTVRSPP